MRGIVVAMLLGLGGPVLGGVLLFSVVVAILGFNVVIQSPASILSLDVGIVGSALSEMARWCVIFCGVALYTGGIAAAISAVLLGVEVARRGTFSAVGAIVAALVGATAEVAILLTARSAGQPLRLSDIAYLGVLLWVLPPICALMSRSVLIRMRAIAATGMPPTSP
jgi:hypothetical protein